MQIAVKYPIEGRTIKIGDGNFPHSVFLGWTMAKGYETKCAVLRMIAPDGAETILALSSAAVSALRELLAKDDSGQPDIMNCPDAPEGYAFWIDTKIINDDTTKAT